MKKPAVIFPFTKKGQTDVVEIIRVIIIVIVLAWVGWIIAGTYGLQESIIEIAKTVLIVVSFVASVPIAYLVYRTFYSEIAAIAVFLVWVGVLIAIVLGVPTSVALIGAGGVIAMVLGVYFVYTMRKRAFEEEQRKKGLVRFVDRSGNEKWGTPKEVEKWEKEDFEKRQIEKGLVKYKGKWVTPDEREKLKKGLVKHVDRFGIEIWDKPAKIEKLKKIDEEERIKESKLYKVVEAIEEFGPARKYGHELPYQTELRGWLKSKFPNTDIEIQRGASRPDIVIDDDIAVEVKGPTGVRELKDLSDKCVRYLRHFDNFIIVLFEVDVPDEHYEEFEEGLAERFPEVKVIRKD